MENSNKFSLANLGHFLISGLGLLFSLTGAASLLFFGTYSWIVQQKATEDLQPYFSLGWTSGLVAILFVPSLVISFMRLIDKPLPEWRFPHFHWLIGGLMLLWPVLLLIGNQLATQTTLSLLVLPPVQLLAVVIPLLFFVTFALSKLPQTSSQRSQGVISFGMAITMPLTIGVELAFIIVLLVLFAVWVISQPDIANQFSLLADQVRQANMDAETLLKLFGPLVQQPAVIFSALALTSGLFPVIEELIKPLPLWFLAGKLTPEEGFRLGLISGAIFALLETLGNLSSPAGSQWAMLIFTRAGTGLLHITCTGLVGWGLASGWKNGKILRLGLAFLLAVCLHGTWNIFGLMIGVAPALHLSIWQGTIGWLGALAPYALVVISLILVLVLFLVNRSLRNTAKISEQVL
jgi:hypothetical protein